MTPPPIAAAAVVPLAGPLAPDPFDTLFERHWAPLRAYCQRILGNADEAQDAAQETMVRLYQRLWRTKEPAPLKPLLFAIARNHCIDRLRERRRDAGPVEEDHLPLAAGADDLAASRGRVDVLVDDLRALSERQRSAVVLREACGLSHTEIADTLETTPARVKSLISEARQALAERRAGRELSCEEYRGARARMRGRVQNQRLLAHRAACARCGERPLAVHVLGLPALGIAWLLRGARQVLRLTGSVGGAPAGAKLAVGLACVATASAPAVQALDAEGAARPRAAASEGHAAAPASPTAQPTIRYAPPAPRRTRVIRAAAVAGRFRHATPGKPAADPAGADRPRQPSLSPGPPAASTLATSVVRSAQVAAGRVRGVVQDAVALRSRVVDRAEQKISAANPTLGSATVVEVEGAVALQLTKANPGRPGDAKPGVSAAEIAQLPKGATR